ncbi:MAG: hypothetical protein GXO28_00315 [Methanopyri archaeon]|nr:hypothetical protein [Methanopyri archaeon]
MPITVVYHNVHSPRKVEEMARTAVGFGAKRFVVSRALGSAAQEGVPAAQLACLEGDVDFMVFSDLKEALRVLEPDRVYMAEDAEHGGSRPFDPSEVADRLRDGEEVVFVFGSSRPGLSKRELELGDEAVYVGSEGNIGEVGALAIVLWSLSRELGEEG